MPVDDNAFLQLRTARDQTAFLHVSCTEWKNLFSFEIYGRDGKLHIDGLGGSYGVERLTYYRMLPEMGPPETTTWEYPRGDQSWALEFAEFLDDIRLERDAVGGPGGRARRSGRRRRHLPTVGIPLLRVGGLGRLKMIITRSPLRITLGGGGTDLPSYYREHGGFLIAAAIDKYVYVTVMRPFVEGIFLKYSKLEHVERDRRRAASDHSRSDPDARISGRRRSKSRRLPTSRPAPASARRAASRRRC